MTKYTKNSSCSQYLTDVLALLVDITDTDRMKVIRLAKHFKPDHYRLNLNFDTPKRTFIGSVTIHGRKLKPSKRIVLHSKGLRVNRAEIVRHHKGNKDQVDVLRVVSHKSSEEIRLHSTGQLYPGEYEINLEFTGKITDQMAGVYPCKFTNNGQEDQLIATQFESHFAREVFPCVDEPEAKATFDLTLETEAGYTTVGNTPILEQKLTDGSERLITTFETTPIMSTYLLAFVYGHMDYLEKKTSRDIVVRAYATPDKIDLLELALDTAIKALDVFEDYFGIPYPLAKCDLVALPDFEMGAMENWGCITFREADMLFDPQTGSVSHKQRIAQVVIHELGHQWFGNLVTMEWWSDLWLNEGFARWTEHAIGDVLYPEFHLGEDFIATGQEAALGLDSLASTHAIEVNVPDPDVIKSLFDQISYDKGAAVIGMIHEYIGAKDFQKGLQHYLKKHAYGNTLTHDLWQSLEDVSKKPVGQFAGEWIKQLGYPIVDVSVSHQKITTNQHRFYIDPSHESDDTLWPIPLNVTNSSIQTTKSMTVDVNQNFNVINSGRSGFYRTVYDNSHEAKLRKLVTSKSLPSTDRYGLLVDAAEAARGGYKPTQEVLELITAYKTEDNRDVWSGLSAKLAKIQQVFSSDQTDPLFNDFARDLIARQQKVLGWKSKDFEDETTAQKRRILFSIAVDAEEPDAISLSNKTVEAASTFADVPANLRSTMYIGALRVNEDEFFEKLVKWYKSPISSIEKTSLLVGLSSVRDPKKIQTCFELSTGEHTRSQDLGFWWSALLANRHARRQTWQWIQDNWKWIDEKVGGSSIMLRIPLRVGQASYERDVLEEFQKFFKPMTDAGFKITINQGQEFLNSQILWRERDYEKVLEFLRKHQ